MGLSDLASESTRQQLATLLALGLEATGLAHRTGSKLPWKCLAAAQSWQDASVTPWHNLSLWPLSYCLLDNK